MFEGFERFEIDTGEAVIRGVTGGAGPALLLLHGYPQTHAMWHKVAPALAERFRVIAPDLRGYGASSKPASTADHAPYSKRAIARDMAEVMTALGHERFDLCGHDRGGRVAHRLALDAEPRVRRLAVLDIAPTREMYRNTSEAFARAYWHWFWLILPSPQPERMICADPEAFLRYKCGHGSAGMAPFAPEAWAAYLAAICDPATVHAMCEDYRAAASIDLAHDDADGARRLALPLLALWGQHGVIERCFDCLALWRERASDVRGTALPGGHYLAEELPDLITDHLIRFFEGAP
ncbi:MAG: alpha/beta hydrolase [Pseudomonadota bacterium]